MKTIRVSSYATHRYRGVVSCGTDHLPQFDAGLPPDSIRHLCSEVRFGSAGPRYRQVDLVVDLPPGDSVKVDLGSLTPFDAKPIDIGSIGAYGLPMVETLASDGEVLNRRPLDPHGGEVMGSTIRARFAGRIASMVWLDLDVLFDPRDRFGRWKATLTCANPDVPDVVFRAPAAFRLAWSGRGSAVVKTGLLMPILLRAGEQMAQGQARFAYGAVGWPGSDSGSYLAAAQSAVWAKDLTLKSPIGLPTPERHPSFNSMAWSNRFFGSTLAVLDGYGTDWELGWLPASGSTGAVEDMGYAKGGDGDEPGTLASRYHTAMRWGARPMHWLEPNGQLLQRENHPNLILYSGQPYLHPPGTDRLGLARNPTGLDTNGWTGPDPSHSSMGNVFYAAAATQCPAALRLVEHKATYLLFAETLNPAWATSSPGESRALMWSCLAFANCIALVRDGVLRGRLLAHLIAKIERIYLPFYEQQGGVLYRYNWDPRAGISQAYSQWMSCWQQAGGAFGLWVLATMPEVMAANPTLASRLRSVAVQAAQLVVDRCITDVTTDSPPQPNPLPTDEAPYGYEPPAGDVVEPYTIWDTIGLVNGLPEADSTQIVEGVAAHYSGYFREAWVPLATWVAAQNGDRRAIQIHQHIRTGALNNPRAELSWIPPLA